MIGEFEVCPELRTFSRRYRDLHLHRRNPVARLIRSYCFVEFVCWRSWLRSSRASKAFGSSLYRVRSARSDEISLISCADRFPVSPGRILCWNWTFTAVAKTLFRGRGFWTSIYWSLICRKVFVLLLRFPRRKFRRESPTVTRSLQLRCFPD